MKKIEWMDLSAIGVYFGSFRDTGVAGISVVDMSGQHGDAIRKLGFEPMPSTYGRDIYRKPNHTLTAASLKEAFGAEHVKWVSGSPELIQNIFKGKVAEKRNATVNAMYDSAKAIGMNDRDEVVFDSTSGRFVQRVIGGQKSIVRDDGLERATFLRARTDSELRQVVRGFVRRIVVRNNNLKREDLQALMTLSNEGGFTERQYQEAVETEANLLFQDQARAHLARGWDAMGVFDIANRIYLGLPKMAHRTASSMALQQYSTPTPMAVLAQAMLASREELVGRSVLDPTIGNSSLVTTFNVGRADDARSRIYGIELDEERVAAARDFADKVVQGDATEVSFRKQFGEPDGFDYVIANPPFGKMNSKRTVRLPDGSATDEMEVQRLDHYILLRALHARRDNGRAVFITGADSTVDEGAIEGRSKHLLAYLLDHYHVDGVVEVSGDLYKKQGAAYPLRMYVVGARRAAPVESVIPERLPVIRSYDELRKWSQTIIDRRDNPAIAPELRVMSPRASDQARRAMHAHTGEIDIVNYLAEQARSVNAGLHRYAFESKILSLVIPQPGKDAILRTPGAFWWDDRNPRIALRGMDGRFMVVALQRRAGKFATMNVLAMGDEAERRYSGAFERLVMAEAGRDPDEKPQAKPAPATAPAPAAVAPAEVVDQVAAQAAENAAEALNTYAVDLPDLLAVTAGLRDGTHPANGKPIASEGVRKQLLTEAAGLIGSLESVKEARPDDAEVTRAVDEAVAAAKLAIEASQPIAAQGSERLRPAADALPWTMTAAEWDAAMAAIARPDVIGRHPGGREIARISERERLRDGVTQWYHARAKAGDADALEWVTDGFGRVTHEEVIRKAIAEGKAVPEHVLAEYPALSAAPADPGAAVREQILGLRGVVGGMGPFTDLPQGWIVMNAPRPLLGDQLLQGDFLHGRFYAAIDPASDMAARYIEQNRRDDAYVLFAAGEATLMAMALQNLDPRYHAAYLEYDEADRKEILRPQINKLNEGKTYGELVALAAKGMPATAMPQPEAAPTSEAPRTVASADANEVPGVPVSAQVPANAFVEEIRRLVQVSFSRDAYRNSAMEAFNGAVDGDRAALYAMLNLQRGVPRSVLATAMEDFWVAQRAVAQASAEAVADGTTATAEVVDPNIGRKWATPGGEIEIIAHWQGNPAKYQTLLNGKVLGAPIVERDTLEARIREDAQRVVDREARRAAQQAREQAAQQAATLAQDLGGFTDGLSPQRRGKIVATLDKTYTLNQREPRKLRDHIRQLVADGYQITRSPDGERRLTGPANNFFDERAILKTGMDFAEFLIAGANAARLDAQEGAANIEAEPVVIPPASDVLPVAESASPAPDAVDTLDALLQMPDLPEGALAEDKRADNEFQQPYVAFSNAGEASMMIPANLSGPVYAALAMVKARHGDIDEYVAKALQFEVSDLERLNMKPEQIDALALIFAAHDQHLGFLLADKMGAGKGRVIALVARRERLEGRIPVFVTVTDNLFTDFLERDMVDVDSRALFKNPLIINDNSKTVDRDGNIVVRSLKRDVYRRYAEAGELPPETDIILLTYSQLSRRPESHLTSRFMLQVADKFPISMLLDESHNGAGSSNTSDNLAAMTTLVERRGGNLLFSSGTPIKGAKNLRLYRAILPKGINTEELLEAVASDPLSLQEALNYEIAARGCLISRELDSSNVVREFRESPRKERNLRVADQVSEILSGMAFLSGDVKKIVGQINREYAKELEKIPESEREGARMGATSMNFGSRLHAITGQLLLALKMPDVLDYAVQALAENVKPIIALRRTGESLLAEYIGEQELAHEPDSTRRKKEMGTVTLERPITFKDYLRRTLERLLVITDTNRYGKVSKRRALGEEIEAVTERLHGLIDELPDDLPLTPIDYLREGLASYGHSMVEVSGRSLRARTMENGKVAVEAQPGKTDKTRVQRAVRAFNNGDPGADVILLTSSGSTGISLHASPATGSDLRPRRMIKAEMQSDITQERQMDGRHDRTGSVERPEYLIPLTGLPADDRLAMMFNNANRSLTASTVANRDSGELIKHVPDLLNVVGDEVAHRMLLEHPGLADKLDIKMPDDGDVFMKGPLWFVKSLTGHMTLLRSEEQFALYAELQARFTERLDQLKAEGRNPLEVVCHDWRAVRTGRSIFQGGAKEQPAAAQAAQAAGGSMFDAPVYLTTLEYQQEMKAVRALEVDEQIGKADGRDHGAGSAMAIVENLRSRREALLQQVTGKKFDSVAQALAAPVDKDNKPNETRKLADKLDWMERNLEVLGRGSVFYQKDLTGEAQPHVVVYYSLPGKPEEYARPSSYYVYTLQPGTDVINTVTLSALAAEGINFEPNAFKDHLDARDAFDDAENGIVTRRVRVLDGNLFDATGLNLREHVGRKIVYTDDSGSRQHGILVYPHITDKALNSLAERVRDPALVAQLIESGPVGTNPSGKVETDDRWAVYFYKNREGDYLFRVPGSVARGGQYFLDPVLSVIKGVETLNRFELDFKEINGGRRATVPAHRLQAVISYLIDQHNENFFLNDRERLAKARLELARAANPLDLAA